MKTTRFLKLLSFIVCTLLIAAMALFTTGCNDNSTKTGNESDILPEEIHVLGEGETQFIFAVTDVQGVQTAYEIHTDEKIVGEALQALELIDGEEGIYGLYVKTVNGQTLDYDKDGKYWAFYIDGKMAPSGVDMTEITQGATYSFKAE